MWCSVYSPVRSRPRPRTARAAARHTRPNTTPPPGSAAAGSCPPSARRTADARCMSAAGWRTRSAISLSTRCHCAHSCQPVGDNTSSNINNFLTSILYNFFNKFWLQTPFWLITLTFYIWLYMYVDDVLCTNLNKISLRLSVLFFFLFLNLFSSLFSRLWKFQFYFISEIVGIILKILNSNIWMKILSQVMSTYNPHDSHHCIHMVPFVGGMPGNTVENMV